MDAQRDLTFFCAFSKFYGEDRIARYVEDQLLVAEEAVCPKGYSYIEMPLGDVCVNNFWGK